MNPTMEKFGYPDSLVRAYEYWCVLLRPQQATLGALVLACREPVQALGEVSAAAMAELSRISADIEQTLAGCFDYRKINYLMLMMVDPDVHFHVLPRYDDRRVHAGVTFADPGWPGPPALGEVTATDDAFNAALRDHLRARWPD